MNFESVSPSLATGSAWMLGMRAVLRLIGLVNVSILARLLSPDDFGVVAMATLVVGFLQLLADVNVDLLLLRQDKVSDHQMNVAWTLQALAGIAISVVCLAMAPLIALYYSEPRVSLVLYVVALQPGIAGLENIGVVKFRKELRFDLEFAYWVIRNLMRFGFGLGLALALRSYLALAIAVPASAAITVAVSYWMSPFRPRLAFADVHHVWKSARWLVAMNVGQYLAFRADEFVVGRYAGASSMGTYYVASDFATMINRELVGAIGRAVYPTLSRVRGDAGEVATAFQHVFGFHIIACLSIGAGLALVAPDIVPLVLGAAWGQGVPIFAWIALCSIFEGLTIASLPFLITTGHERFTGLYYISHGTLLYVILLLGGNTGELVHITQLRCGVAALALAVILWRLWTLNIARPGEILALGWRPILSAAVMAGAVLQLSRLGLPEASVIRLAVEVAGGATAFITTLFTLWILAGKPKSPEHDILLTAVSLTSRVFRR